MDKWITCAKELGFTHGAFIDVATLRPQQTIPPNLRRILTVTTVTITIRHRTVTTVTDRKGVYG